LPRIWLLDLFEYLSDGPHRDPVPCFAGRFARDIEQRLAIRKIPLAYIEAVDLLMQCSFWPSSEGASSIYYPEVRPPRGYRQLSLLLRCRICCLFCRHRLRPPLKRWQTQRPQVMCLTPSLGFSMIGHNLKVTSGASPHTRQRTCRFWLPQTSRLSLFSLVPGTRW
jgi:hypothetical protein